MVESAGTSQPTVRPHWAPPVHTDDGTAAVGHPQGRAGGTILLTTGRARSALVLTASYLLALWTAGSQDYAGQALAETVYQRILLVGAVRQLARRAPRDACGLTQRPLSNATVRAAQVFAIIAGFVLGDVQWTIYAFGGVLAVALVVRLSRSAAALAAP